MLRLLARFTQQKLTWPKQELSWLGKETRSRIGRIDVSRRYEIARRNRQLATNTRLGNSILKTEVLMSSQPTWQIVTALFEQQS